MKTTPLISSFAIALTLGFASITANAGTTAKQAIATLKKMEGTTVASQIVSVTGRFGQDQPQEWEILAKRGDQHAMYIVDKKKVLSVSKVRTKSANILKTDAVKVDSSKAFLVADNSAKKADVGFDSLNYQLKARKDKATAVWVVRLVNTAGLTVGEVHVAADSGSVLHTNWDKERLNRPKTPATGSNRGIIADRRGGSVQTSTAGDAVRNGLRNVFRRGEVSKQPERRGPRTSKVRPR